MDRQAAEYLYEEAEKPIDIKYYLYLIKKNLSAVITFFVIAVTLGAVYGAKIPDSYQATARLIIEKPTLAPGGRVPTVEGRPMDGAGVEYDTEIQMMKSTAVMLQVVNDLRLTDYFGVETEEEAAARIQGMLTVGPSTQKSRIFNMTVTAPEPQLAANLANAMARGYVRVNFENSLYYSKEILNWLPQEGDPNETIAVKDPSGMMRQMRRQEVYDSMPVFQVDPTMRELREKKAAMESEIQLLSRQYRDKHPSMIKARANLKFITDTMENEKKRILEEYKAQAQGQYKLSDTRILEEAKTPGGPLPVNRFKPILIFGMAELLLSLLIIILIDFFDQTIKSVEDLERKGIVLPLLGHVPLLKSKNKWDKESTENLAAYNKELPEIAEAFRYIRVAINFSGSPESLKTLVVASCLPHEGKSFTAHNLAISFAVDGNKTLLVDGDMRRPVVHKRFRMENTAGLSNYLTSAIDFDSIVKESFVENLSLVMAGPASPNPTEILGSQRMKQFLQEAKSRFDRVIIDCPPLTGIGDGAVVGAHLGQLILIISAGQTPVDLIKQNQKNLEKMNVKIMGTILNMVDMEKERYGGYYKYYHHTYNRYYSADKEKSG